MIIFEKPSIPFEFKLGWRYTRAKKDSRKNHFISFISAVSMLGIALGVAALIIVLSVMNGFQKEVRDRMLAVVSHVEVVPSTGGELLDWQALGQKTLGNPGVLAYAPYVAEQALLVKGDLMRGSLVRGIDPSLEGGVAEFATQLPQSLKDALQPGRYGVILGDEMAQAMGVAEVTLWCSWRQVAN